ncbi:MAG: response regulator [bacterium]|nr:response regulator [bacterium]
MNKDNLIKIFLVDDDAVFLKLLSIEFRAIPGFEIETFSTGELCIARLSEQPQVVILDYHLDGIVEHAMNGIETLDKIKSFNPEIPVIMLSSQDKIEVAINCMHHQAFDYVVKSETAFLRLQKLVTTLMETQKLKKQISWYMDRM